MATFPKEMACCSDLTYWNKNYAINATETQQDGKVGCCKKTKVGVNCALSDLCSGPGVLGAGSSAKAKAKAKGETMEDRPAVDWGLCWY